MNHTEESRLFAIKTGIYYVSIPEPSIKLIQPSYEIDREFLLTNAELNQLTDSIRYRLAYENLSKIFQNSIENHFYLTNEIIRLKYSIEYTEEILPIFIHNHKLAEKEKKIFYDILKKTWQKFDENIQNEIHIQYQLDQIQRNHDDLRRKKCQQEQSQIYANQIQDLNQQILLLKRDIQQFHDYKFELENDIDEIEILCSHYFHQLDYLQSTVLRSHLRQYNQLQIERDSILTDIQLIKYHLFEHNQEYDLFIINSRQSLKQFRLTIHELEQQLKQQTNQELNYFEMKNFFPRQTLQDETQKLINILEIRNQEKQLLLKQNEILFENIHEQILQQKQLKIKKEKDYLTMEHIEQELNQNLHIYREMYLQLKTERRSFERELNIKLKQFSMDDRLNHNLNQQIESFIARKKLEQIRSNTKTDQIEQLIDENNRLQISFEQLSNQSIKFHPKLINDLRETIFNLKQIENNFSQIKIQDEYKQTRLTIVHEQIQRKTHVISLKIQSILNRIQIYDRNFHDNSKYIQSIEKQLNQQQIFHYQSENILKQLKNRSDIREKKIATITKQMQIASNNIQHSQYRLKISTEHFSICQNDLRIQRKSLDKLDEFHRSLCEQDEIQTKNLSTLQNQFIHFHQQYQQTNQSLEQINNQLKQSTQSRIVLSGMIIRRMNLCKLLYKKFENIDRSIHQRAQKILLMNKSIQTLKNEIKHIRKDNQRICERNQYVHLQCFKIHLEFSVEQSKKKQENLMKRIFQEHFRNKKYFNSSNDNKHDLNKKYYLLKIRFMKMIFRGIIANFVFMTIQQEFHSNLEIYTSKSKRMQFEQLNIVRSHLNNLIQKLKAKSAENHMLIDIHNQLDFIHQHFIEQLK